MPMLPGSTAWWWYEPCETCGAPDWFYCMDADRNPMGAPCASRQMKPGAYKICDDCGYLWHEHRAKKCPEPDPKSAERARRYRARQVTK